MSDAYAHQDEPDTDRAARASASPLLRDATSCGGQEDATALQRQVRDLRSALSSRPVIEQAKGALMQRYRIDDQTAFTVLVRLSQETNRKVREIAATVCEVACGRSEPSEVERHPELARILDQLGHRAPSEEQTMADARPSGGPPAAGDAPP